MKVGDLVKHVHTGYIAIVRRMPRSIPGPEMVGVLTSEGPGAWWFAACEVISESR